MMVACTCEAQWVKGGHWRYNGVDIVSDVERYLYIGDRMAVGAPPCMALMEV